VCAECPCESVTLHRDDMRTDVLCFGVHENPPLEVNAAE